MIADHALAGLGKIRHGFFTREGGVSAGDFTSLNCGFGSGDVLEKVAENRRRVAADAPGPAPRYQRHAEVWFDGFARHA
jgi:copper oxidase (laccase) domain-containing protein